MPARAAINCPVDWASPAASEPAPKSASPASSSLLQAVARFLRAGFVLGPEVQLPEKRARLVFLEREAFTGA
jgi:hypothetical protein